MKKKYLAALVLGLVLVFVGREVYLRIQEKSASSGGRPGVNGQTPGNSPGSGGQAGQGGSAGPAGAGGARRAAAVAVETMKIDVRDIRDIGEFSGSLEARSRFVLAPKVAGRLDRILVGIGDTITKGQLIAVLDGSEYRRQVEQAEADLEVAEANLDDAKGSLETARRDFERTKALYTNKIASATELDTAESAFRKADTQYKVVGAVLRQKEAALAVVQDRLDSTRLSASWTSPEKTRVIGERFSDEGALLRANDPVVSVLAIESLTATFNATETVYPRMKPGLPTLLTTDILPGKNFVGRVERVSPFLNPTTRQAEVRIEVENPTGELKPGMFVQIFIEFGRRPGARTIPASGLVKRGDKAGVFLLDAEGKKVSFVPVTTGITQNERIEITEPLLSGQIVVLGHHLLEDGSMVILPTPSTAGGPGKKGDKPGAKPEGGKS